jgi:hypothetical protein
LKIDYQSKQSNQRSEGKASMAEETCNIDARPPQVLGASNKNVRRTLAAKQNPALTSERLKSLLDYDPGTGDFCWLVTDRKRRAGALAGTINNRGYRIIVIDYKARCAGRLAYFYMTGNWPESVVDYIDHDTLNSRWTNLDPRLERKTTPIEK